MGCGQSKIENEESVFRCKQRKQFMKTAVAARNAFAAAHSAYTMSLKNTGAALNDYGQGETTEIRGTGLQINPQILDPLPPAPPPPPLPKFSPPPHYQPAPLPRSVSLPPIPLQKVQTTASASPEKSPSRSAVPEEDDIEEEVEHVAKVAAPPPPPPPVTNPPPPPPPPQTSSWEFFDNYMFNTNAYTPHEGRASVEETEPDHSEMRQIREDEGTPELDDEADADPDPKDDNPVDSPVKTPSTDKLVQHHKIAEKSKNDMQLAVPSEPKGGNKGGKDLLQVLQELDDHFLKASESGQEVSRMLEANRLHYHSNFADNKGLIDHSARVMRVITWNRSFKGSYASEDGNDEMQGEERETHASVLDKLLAWEKKLYDEVKAGELMKIEYQKKIAMLNRQKKRGGNGESMEKTRAAVKYLHTRYMVDFQAMDSTSSEIRRLRDEQLYPNLVDLVARMEEMWRNMYAHHARQQEIVSDLRALENPNAPDETTDQHYHRTVQLRTVVNEWHTQSSKLITHQREYISALNNWLRLNLVPIESNLKEKVSSPQKMVLPPIHDLLQEWHNQLDKLPDTVATEAIKTFAAIIQRIVAQQEDEMKQKIRYEQAKNEYSRKNRAFEEWKQKYRDKMAADDNGGERTEGNNRDPLTERQAAIDLLKRKVVDEKEKYQKACNYTRAMSLNSLKTGLPAVFQAMAGFAHVCSEVYKELRLIASDKKSLQNGQ